MKELGAAAEETVGVSPEGVVSFLAQVDRYPSWYPEVVRSADVLERGSDGVPVRARADVHLALGPISRNLELVLDVVVDPAREVRLTRVGDNASDQERFQLLWRVDDGPPTRLRLELSAYVDLPRFVPVSALGGPFAQGFVQAAARALDSG